MRNPKRQKPRRREALVQGSRGAAAIEYTLLVALFSLTIIPTISGVHTQSVGAFQEVNKALNQTPGIRIRDNHFDVTHLRDVNGSPGGSDFSASHSQDGGGVYPGETRLYGGGSNGTKPPPNHGDDTDEDAGGSDDGRRNGGTDTQGPPRNPARR